MKHRPQSDQAACECDFSATKPPFFDIKSVRARLKKPDPWKDFWKSAVRLGRLKDIPGL